MNSDISIFVIELNKNVFGKHVKESSTSKTAKDIFERY